MSIDNRSKPDANSSTRMLRFQAQGSKIAKSIETLGSQVSSVNSGNHRTESPSEELGMIDPFSQLSENKQARQDDLKKNLKKAAQDSNEIKEHAKEQYKVAGKNAQAVAAQLIIGLDKKALKYLQKKDASGEFVDLSPEEFEAKVDAILEDPEQIPFIMKNALTSDMEAKRKEFKDDPEKLAELEEYETQFLPIFNALDKLDQNGSHLAMFDTVSSFIKKSVSGKKVTKLWNDYKQSLDDIAAKQGGVMLRLAQEMKSRVGGITSKVDKREYRRLFARVGGMIADRNGGISGAGQIYNFMEADIAVAGNPLEKSDLGLSEYSELDIRRLLPEELAINTRRTYTGQALDEHNPSPQYVYVDSEIPIEGNLPFDHINGTSDMVS